MNPKFALASILIAGLLLAMPTASATGHENGYGSPSGATNTRYAEHAQECLDAASDGTTCVVLYAHIFDLLNKVPINVQHPPTGAEDLSRGFTGQPGYEPLWDFNDFTLYSSPGFVEYPNPGSGDEPRLHPERGLSSNVEFASDQDMIGVWYMSADTDEFSPLGIDKAPTGEDPGVGVMPCLTVQMTLQTGREVGEGETLSQGKSVYSVVSGADDPGLSGQVNPCPSGEAVIDASKVSELRVNMPPPTGEIPKTKGFLFHIEWWMHDQNGKIYSHNWNVHTGENYMARVVLPIKNPVRVETVRPQFFDGDLYVHGVLNSPWGSYDVDPASIRMEILSEGGQPVSTSNIEPPILRYSVDHDGHFKPVNATFKWDYDADGVAPGTYTVRMYAKNWQHTAETFTDAKIVIEKDISKSSAIDSEGNEAVGDPKSKVVSEESPAFAASFLAVLAVALLGVARKRFE